MSHAIFTPATMRVRGAVREVLKRVAQQHAMDSTAEASETATGAAPVRPPVCGLVALSGGADSLALAVCVAAEADALGIGFGAVIVDHGLQQGSAQVAARAANQARKLALDPVLVRRVEVESERSSLTGGVEAAARLARYDALTAAASSCGARWVLTAHTRDDQSEQVLLALARGSGTRSIAGIPSERQLGDGITLVRPLLAERHGVTRQVTEQVCEELGLAFWRDPHNVDPSFARVRVRERVLPQLAVELGPGVAANLARSADLAREDADALDELAAQRFAAMREAPEDRQDHGNDGRAERSILVLSARALAEQPDALRNRIIRIAALESLNTSISRRQTLAVASLVTAWKGQGPIQVVGGSVQRKDGRLIFFKLLA